MILGLVLVEMVSGCHPHPLDGAGRRSGQWGLAQFLLSPMSNSFLFTSSLPLIAPERYGGIAWCIATEEHMDDDEGAGGDDEKLIVALTLAAAAAAAASRLLGHN